MRQLATVWTKHLKSTKEKQDFERLVRNNTVVFSRLVNILKEKQEANNKLNVADYDSPSWAFKQADRNGYERAIQDLLDLFNFMEK